jgi:hypothetical protein
MFFPNYMRMKRLKHAEEDSAWYWKLTPFHAMLKVFMKTSCVDHIISLCQEIVCDVFNPLMSRSMILYKHENLDV